MAIILQYAAADDTGAQTAFPDCDILSVPPLQWDAPMQEWAFSGVDGVEHIVDDRKGRDLIVRVRFRFRATAAALRTDIETIEAAKNTLFGSVSIPGILGGTYVKCTFRGIRIDRRPTGNAFEYDGSGINGWIATGMLMWRQRGHV